MEITPVQAASLLGKSERTIQRRIKLKKLPARELADGSYRVSTEDLEPFMQQSDESLLARIETLEQDVEEHGQRIEALEHRPPTTPAPAGKKGRKKAKKKSTK
jgi:excisionase family DNA binding protein